MKLLPICLGKYDQHAPACNGEPSSSYLDDREPCVFRDRCSAFQKNLSHQHERIEDHLQEASIHVSGVVQEYTVAKNPFFSEELVKLVKLWRVENGRPRNTKPIDNKPNRIGGARKKRHVEVHERGLDWRARVARRYAKRNEAHARDKKIAKWFADCLSDELRLPVHPVLPGTPIGGVYMCWDAVGRVSFYVRTKKAPLPLVRLRPNGALYDGTSAFLPVALAAVIAHLGGATIVPVIHNHRVYTTKFVRLGREGVTWVAILVARLIKSGNIMVAR